MRASRTLLASATTTTNTTSIALDGAVCFVARSYTDTSDEAHFLRVELDGDPRHLTDADLTHPLFVAARSHLIGAGKVHLNWLSGRGNGYEPIPSDPLSGG